RVLLNLSTLYHSQKRFPEAEDVNRRALQIQEKMLDANDPDVAATLSSRGVILAATSRCSEAITALERARVTYASSLGPDHPYFATVLQKLGAAKACVRDYREAVRLLNAALEIRRKVLPANHPETAITLFSLANVYRDMGNRKASAESRKEA